MRRKIPSKLDSLSDLEIGWIAGILDGEGCLGVYGAEGHYGPVINVVSTDFDTIEKLHFLSGIGRGNKYQPKGARRLQYRWGLRATSDVLLFLSKIAPHMVTKRKQAMLLLRYCALKVTHSKINEGDFYLETKELNKRGKEL